MKAKHLTALRVFGRLVQGIETAATHPSESPGPPELDESIRKVLATVCVYPACTNSRRTRGLCHQHYQTMRSYVRAGKASEADLTARGLLTAKGVGGGYVIGHAAFLSSSHRRGSA